MESSIFVIVTIVISLIALIVSVAQYNSHQNRQDREDERKVDDRLDKLEAKFNKELSQYKIEMEHRITELESHVNIFWKDFEKKMANYLHSPHTPETDKLLEKLADKGLEEPEKKELCAKIEEHLKKKEYAPEKVPAALALIAHLCVGV